MIPARMGSQRLERKNLRELRGLPLIVRAIRKCLESGCFDEVWVNSEHADFAKIAASEGVLFHQRPEALGNNAATSEQYVEEFLSTHDCEELYQVHSIAPLVTVADIQDFVARMQKGDVDTLLSAEDVQIECAFEGQPVNFSFEVKTNSQDLTPVQRISWSLTGWRRSVYLEACRAGLCATYSGRVGIQSLNPLASHVVKTESDLQIAEALYDLAFADARS